MLLFLSPFWTIFGHGTGYRTVQRLRQFLIFFPLLEISVVSLSAKQRQILVVGPHLCTRIWVHSMIGLLKMPLLICQLGWKKIRNTLLVIHWVCCGPRTRISVFLRRHYVPGLNYVFDASDLRHPSVQALGLPTAPTKFKSCQQPG